MKTIKELIAFLKAVATDPRIPAQDKAVIATCLALIVSPIDLIPDWIPIIGWIDDFVILAIVLDYFANHLDQDIILSHYPWGMKSYVRLRKGAQLIASMTPSVVKGKIWSFKPDVYRK
ncbi:MAG: DUF1232 domain-containing protein [Bdellovibrionia bacterium]